VLVGLCGGIPGMLIGIALLQFRLHSVWAFIAAGVLASAIAPLAVMLLTPLGISGLPMLVIAVPSGAAAGYAAHFYLARYTTLLKPQ
jgi:hypothetical protein